jgi:hypothetical protein
MRACDRDRHHPLYRKLLQRRSNDSAVRADARSITPVDGSSAQWGGLSDKHDGREFHCAWNGIRPIAAFI